MNEEIIVTLDSKERLYDYCENAEQFYDKFYLPLIKYVNWLQKQNTELKASLELYENGVIYSSEVDELKEQVDFQLTKIAFLIEENEKLKNIETNLSFIKKRTKQGMTQENINKCAIDFVNSYLKEVE